MGIFRKTKTVKLILQVFSQNNGAITVVELVKLFHEKMNKTTVYRILDRLEDSGILHSFMGKDGLKRYAKWEGENFSSNNMKIHPHFLCKDCGESTCLPIKMPIPSVPDYKIDSVEQMLIGKCKNCLSY